jgi:shikimate dehydrogenase
MRHADTGTHLCAVIGNPVEHSLSPAIHNAAFEAANLNYTYLAFRVENLGGFLTGMRAMPSFRGLSVTIPHKIAIMRHLDLIEPMARMIGSVNTVTNDGGRLVGASTDGPGALRAFEDAGVRLEGKRVLFLGAGGAVRAVAFACVQIGRVEHVTILGRTWSRVAELVEDLQERSRASASADELTTELASCMATHDVVIQGTPVGMYPGTDESPVPPGLFRPDQVVFDMVYRPHETRFLRDARAAGCKVIHGLEMLVNQAALQYERWTGEPAPHSVMRDALTRSLGV